MSSLKVCEFLLPSFWASYLVNGDSSSISENELEAIKDFIKANNLKGCVGCEESGFSFNHDAIEFMPLGADCSTFAFVY